MKIRKHFRTTKGTVDFIISDFNFNRITNKDEYFKKLVNLRIEKLNKNYNNRLDNILNFIIRNCRFDNIPIASLARIINSLSKITTTLSKGFLSLIN